MNDAMKLGLMSVLRTVLVAVGSFAVTKGWIDDATMQQVVGGLVVILTAVWGFLDKREKPQ